jgi:hypothetical protein
LAQFAVAVAVGVRVFVEVFCGVVVAVAVAVRVGVGVPDGVKVIVGVAVFVGVSVGRGVGVIVGVFVQVASTPMLLGRTMLREVRNCSTMPSR